MSVQTSITVRSDAFAEGERIPDKYTGSGEDLSPPLNWGTIPDGTVEWALICDDPDAPTPEPWVHWLIYKIPVDCTQLPEGIPTQYEVSTPAGARQGKNSWRDGQTIGYRGPAPPPGHGTHHYRFTLYAVDQKLELSGGVSRSELEEAMQGHVLATGQIVATFSR